MTGPPEHLRDHWSRPGALPPDRPYLAWHLTPGGDPDLDATVQRIHSGLGGITGLDLIPPQWLHITVQGVGFVDELEPAAVDAMIADARLGLADVPALEIALDPVQVQHEGLVMDGHPIAEIRALRDHLRRFIRDAIGADRVPGSDDERMWPHLSLAYANACTPTAPIRAALAELPDVGTGPVRIAVASVSLIALTSAAHLYRWDPVESVPLGRNARNVIA